MADTRELKIVINSDSSDAEKDLEKFGGSLNRLKNIISADQLRGLAQQGFDFLKNSVFDCVEAFQESQNTLTQLDAVLKSTNNAVGLSKDALVDLSAQLQNTTTYSDEAVLSAENLLLTFTNIGKDVFPEATRVVLDMSTALGQDTKNSAIQLGKALQDPILGVSALRRVGVNFSEDQKEVIENLVETGQSLEAQKLILQELNTEFGGSATAAASTYAGQMTQLKNAINDVQETIGKGLLENLVGATGGFENLTAKVREINTFLTEHKDLVAAIVVGVAVLAATFLGVMVVAMVVVAGTAGVVVAAIGAVIAVIAALATLVVIHWQEIQKFTLEVWGNIVKFFTDVINKITGAFTALGQKISDIMAGITSSVRGMVNSVVDAINTLIRGVNNIAGKVPGVSLKVPELPKLASGTNNFAGGMAIVGEKGPELVSLPRGSSVTPNNKLAGTGTVNININNPVVREENDIDRIIDAVKKALGRENELARLAAI